MKILVFGALLATTLVLTGCNKVTTTSSPDKDSGEAISISTSTTQEQPRNESATAPDQSEEFAIHRPDLGFAMRHVSVTAKEENECPPRCLPSNALTNYLFEPLGIGAVTLEAFASTDDMINSGAHSYETLEQFMNGLLAENISETNITGGKIISFETPAQSTIPSFSYALILSDTGTTYQVSGASPDLIQEISEAFVLL